LKSEPENNKANIELINLLWITAWDRLQIFAVIQIENCEKYGT